MKDEMKKIEKINPLDYRPQFKDPTKYVEPQLTQKQTEIRIKLALHLLNSEEFSVVQQIILADMMKNDRQVCKVVELYC